MRGQASSLASVQLRFDLLAKRIANGHDEVGALTGWRGALGTQGAQALRHLPNFGQRRLLLSSGSANETEQQHGESERVVSHLRGFGDRKIR